MEDEVIDAERIFLDAVDDFTVIFMMTVFLSEDENILSVSALWTF